MQRTVVNKRHGTPYDVYIGRGSIWGNPFSHMENTKAKFKVNSREEAITKYAEWILTQPELIEQLPTIQGKIKQCYCYPLRCHGDILEELAQELPDLKGVEKPEDCPGYTRADSSSHLCNNKKCPRRLYCDWSVNMTERL